MEVGYFEVPLVEEHQRLAVLGLLHLEGIVGLWGVEGTMGDLVAHSRFQLVSAQLLVAALKEVAQPSLEKHRWLSAVAQVAGAQGVDAAVSGDRVTSPA